jgi:hypothetical protein
MRPNFPACPPANVLVLGSLFFVGLAEPGRARTDDATTELWSIVESGPRPSDGTMPVSSHVGLSRHATRS